MNHNMNNTTYVLWSNIKARCYNINHYAYKNYGGRGIGMYHGWLNNFDEFYKYIRDRPTKQHSLDRINNDGNYEPGNIKWSTQHEQQSNRSNNNKVCGVGFNKHYGKWYAKLTVNGVCVSFKYYLNEQDAINARIKLENEYL